MDTGSYHKTWHRCRRKVLALAARSSDEENQADTPHTSCVDTDHQDCSGAIQHEGHKQKEGCVQQDCLVCSNTRYLIIYESWKNFYIVIIIFSFK